MLQHASPEPVSDSRRRVRLAVSLLAGGGGIVAVMAALARGMGWYWTFIIEGDPYYSPVAAQWISTFIASGAAALLLSVLATAHHRLGTNLIVRWSRSFLVFLALITGVVALHFWTLTVALSDRSTAPPNPPDEEHVLLIALLAALLWPTAFGLRTDGRSIVALFVITISVLGVGVVILEPLLLLRWQIWLGLRPPLMHGFLPGVPLEKLFYLLPHGPILWFALADSGFSAWTRRAAGTEAFDAAETSG